VVDNPSHSRLAIAKRMRQNSTGPAPGASPAQVINVVVCPQCGDRFAICQDLIGLDSQLVERQAAWLADQFVWDHIQENKHRSSITLPGAEELKRLAPSRA
jgi:hypothetical protein